jgi:hypothetical protein
VFLVGLGPLHRALAGMVSGYPIVGLLGLFLILTWRLDSAFLS